MTLVNTGQVKPKAQKVGFLLLPNFSMMGFSSAMEPLHMANVITGMSLYDCKTVSVEGDHSLSSIGVEVKTDHNIQDDLRFDILFVIGASPIAKTGHDSTIKWIQKQAKQSTALGGVGTGSYLLAKAGVLDGYRATIHWWNLNNLREEFPNTIVSSNLFEIDRDRYTCSGGTASMDMMLFIIGQHNGTELASAISEHFVLERIRPSDEKQRVPLQSLLGNSQPKLVDAVSLMEANIEEPLTTDDIAFHVGLSRRQLERLFKKYLNSVPSRYYLQIRLERARQMLRESSKPIVQIGLGCGFSSGPHFSTAYRNHFGITPREERIMLSGQS